MAINTPVYFLIFLLIPLGLKLVKLPDKTTKYVLVLPFNAYPCTAIIILMDKCGINLITASGEWGF